MLTTWNRYCRSAWVTVISCPARARSRWNIDGVRERLMEQMMDQAADGVWLVTGTDVNWVLVADGDEVTPGRHRGAA